jgi:transaldolase
VASFFVSRVDTNIDPRLQALGAPAELSGKAAIANARLAYADYKKVFSGERFKKLQAAGARVQRPLWASTSTKNPAYRDVIYLEELIGPDTVNTVPPQTLVAFLDHGLVRPSLEEDLPGALKSISSLEKIGISMDQVTAQLEEEGVKSFSDAYGILLQAVETRLKAAA